MKSVSTISNFPNNRISSSEKVILLHIIKYNKENLPYEETCFSKQGAVLWKQKYIYDDWGNLVCEEKYVPDRIQPSNSSLLLDMVEETKLLYY